MIEIRYVRRPGRLPIYVMRTEGGWSVSYRHESSGATRKGVAVLRLDPVYGYRRGQMHFDSVEEFVRAAEELYAIARKLKQVLDDVGSPSWVHSVLRVRGELPLDEIRRMLVLSRAQKAKG